MRWWRSNWALLAAWGCAAQTPGGRITGRVTDATAGVVANATVEARHTETGLNRGTRTDATGEYLEGIIIDISDRKHAEEAERHIEALRSVAALANAAAHEINNPLAVMVAHVDIEALRTQDPETQKRLAKIRAAAQRIREIVAHMHRVTRVELAADPPGLPDRLDLDRSSDLP